MSSASISHLVERPFDVYFFLKMDPLSREDCIHTLSYYQFVFYPFSAFSRKYIPEMYRFIHHRYYSSSYGASCQPQRRSHVAMISYRRQCYRILDEVVEIYRDILLLYTRSIVKISLRYITVHPTLYQNPKEIIIIKKEQIFPII